MIRRGRMMMMMMMSRMKINACGRNMIILFSILHSSFFSNGLQSLFVQFTFCRPHFHQVKMSIKEKAFISRYNWLWWVMMFIIITIIVMILARAISIDFSHDYGQWLSAEFGWPKRATTALLMLMVVIYKFYRFVWFRLVSFFKFNWFLYLSSINYVIFWGLFAFVTGEEVELDGGLLFVLFLLHLFNLMTFSHFTVGQKVG